jgi:predicted solute-binding protein
MTGLPFVFATWSGPNPRAWPMPPAELATELKASLDFGISQLDRMVAEESAARGFAPALVRDYFTRYIRYDIGAEEQRGLVRFLSYAAEIETPQLADVAVRG